VAIAGIILAAPCLTLAQQVSGLSETSVPCHGYLEVYGNGFGDTPGTLLINGSAAPVAKWSDLEIVTYLQEDAPAGPATLQVSGPAGTSNVFDFEVAPCAPASGRVLWRQRFDSFYTFAKPVVAPDGTIHVLDLRHRLYSITPDGAVNWVVDGALRPEINSDTPILGNTSIDVGPDGTVYGAHEWYVSAINADGSLQWRFDIPLNQRSFITYDTKYGPDGNIYVAASQTITDGRGVYSLTSSGAFRWNVSHIYDRTTRRQIDIVFGPGPRGQQLYFSSNANSYAIALDDGSIIFNNLPQVTGFQAVSPLDGTVHSSNYAYQPDGRIEWQSPIFLNGEMSMDSQGVHYATTSMITPRMVALNPDGSTKYERALDLPSSTSPETTTVTPDDSQLLMNDIFHRLLALRSGNGSEDWRIELPREGVSEAHPQGFASYWLRRPAFSADGTIAYYLAAVNTAGSIRERTFLYALSLNGDAGPPPPSPPPPPPTDLTMRVTDIGLSERVRRNRVTVTARISVADDAGKPVNGALLAATWTKPDGSTAAGSTNTNKKGEGKLQVAAGLGQYTIDIDSVTKDGYVLDEAGSVLTATTAVQ
jgi:hypothetical protein